MFRKLYVIWRIYSISKSLQCRSNYDGDNLLNQLYSELKFMEYPPLKTTGHKEGDPIENS